eukprot:4703593-Pleurochrysis_carterae.AAC.1
MLSDDEVVAQFAAEFDELVGLSALEDALDPSPFATALCIALVVGVELLFEELSVDSAVVVVDEEVLPEAVGSLQVELRVRCVSVRRRSPFCFVEFFLVLREKFLFSERVWRAAAAIGGRSCSIEWPREIAMQFDVVSAERAAFS